MSPVLASVHWEHTAGWLVMTAIAAVSAVAAVFSVMNHRKLKVPSGGTIGEVSERTHALSAADLALTKHVAEKVSNGDPLPVALQTDSEGRQDDPEVESPHA